MGVDLQHLHVVPGNQFPSCQNSICSCWGFAHTGMSVKVSGGLNADSGFATGKNSFCLSPVFLFPPFFMSHHPLHFSLLPCFPVKGKRWHLGCFPAYTVSSFFIFFYRVLGDWREAWIENTEQREKAECYPRLFSLISNLCPLFFKRTKLPSFPSFALNSLLFFLSLPCPSLQITHTRPPPHTRAYTDGITQSRR